MLLSSNRLEPSPWSFTHVFTTIETTTRWNCLSKALRFLVITAEYQDYPFFAVFLTIKTLFQNISITLSQISLKVTNIKSAIGGKSPGERFWKDSSQVIASFRCYDNSDVIATLIITNRPFYRYGGHIELIRVKEYYRMPMGHEHISFVFSSTFRDIFS